MKQTKLVSILLIIATCLMVLAACDSNQQSAAPSINPELVAAFGEEMIESETEDISRLVNGLKDAYAQYQKDQDVYAFGCSIDDVMEGYTGYLEEISDELQYMYQDESDKERKMELLSLHSVSISYIAPKNSWDLYKFSIQNDMTPNYTEQEIAEKLCEYIDSISKFFYCQPITN